MNRLARLSPDTRARFTSAEFLHMVESGAFEGMKVELIDGELERMNPPMGGHAKAQTNILVRLASAVSMDRVWGEVGIVLNDSTVVACDAALLRAPIAENRFLAPADILLVIEIVQTTQGRDLGVKRMLYASASIPTYWTIDGQRRVVHVYAEPVDGNIPASAPCDLASRSPCRAVRQKSRSIRWFGRSRKVTKIFVRAEARRTRRCHA